MILMLNIENISLYICAYNVEKTIEEVIIGVLNMNPKPDEIIIFLFT